MVLAIEPIIDLPDRLHIRVEDTVLVTPTGAEVLSSAVPKEAISFCVRCSLGVSLKTSMPRAISAP